MVKKISLLIFSTVIFLAGRSQLTGSFTVGGDIDKFYPVSFIDGNWANNMPTQLVVGRSSVHTNSDWRGSLQATFKFHVGYWGNGSEHITAEIYSYKTWPTIVPYDFIGGWVDVSGSSDNQRILIWFKGGGTAYFYNSNSVVSPAVYDGSQNALPYQQVNGPAYNYKTSKDLYVNQIGVSGKTAWLEKLYVYGDIKAKSKCHTD
jgi:hypothetical protein